MCGETTASSNDRLGVKITRTDTYGDISIVVDAEGRIKSVDCLLVVL